MSRSKLDGNALDIVKDLTKFNLDWMESIRLNYSNKDFTEVFEKYINN
ncbi:MAG: YvbH-like oligomerization domain-containing protein [Paraclostridium sp.]